MAEFICTLATAGGQVVQRTMTGASEEAVRTALAEQDILVLSLRRKMGLALPFMGPRRHVSASEFLVFNQELAALIRAGLPILGSLDMLIERQKNQAFHQALVSIRDDIRGGASLSEAFKNQGALFPPLFATSLASGERSGEIAAVLERYISYSQSVAEVKKKIIAAAVYPLILMFAMTIVIFIMIIFVFPMFGEFFSTMKADLPLPTKVLLGVSGWLEKHYLLMFGGIAVVVGGFLWWKRTPAGTRWVDSIKFRLPIIGQILHYYSVTRFTRTLGTLLSGGIPMVGSLQIASRTVGNSVFGEKLEEAGQRVQEGGSLWESLEATGLMPDMAVGMIRVGESSGSLTLMLDRVSEFLDEKIDQRIQTLLSLMEPVLLLVMAVVVGGLLLAIYMPLLSSFSSAQM
ncbi:MAG: type II secretion system F family protein [Acidobacteria bacterium]|nr:type II secretion system F family protein [Acidobacteriota bacterium]